MLEEVGSPYIGAKGGEGPKLWVYVKSGEDVSLWDGQHVVASGDTIRLRVEPDGYRHISVFAPRTTPSGFDRLYEGPLAGGPVPLPVSWTIDDRPGDETLLVVLGPVAVSPGEVAALLSRAPPTGIWVRRLVLPKRVPGSDR